MPPDQLYAWLQSMPPELQQSMMQMVLGMGQGQFPVNPYQPIAPMTAYQYTPQLDKYGNEQPWDVDVAQDNLNLQQDLRYNMFRPELAAMSGPGAYGVGAFDPILTNEAEVMQLRPGQVMLSNAAQMDPTSYDGFVAQYLADNPQAGPGEAQRVFWDTASAVEEDGVTPTPEAQLLLDSLPQREVFNQATGTYELRADRNAPLEYAQGIHNELLKDQPVAPQYEDSPATKFYREQGLPTPIEQYGQGNYSLESLVPGYADAQQNFLLANDQYAQQQQTVDERKQAHQAAMQRLAAQPQGARGVTEQLSPGYETPMSGNMGYDTGTGGMTMGIGPDIPGLGPVGGSIQLAAPATERTSTDGPRPGMLPTTTGRTRRNNPNATVEESQTGRRLGAANRAMDQAKLDRRAAYRAANSPEALLQSRQLQALQEANRRPLDDALMQRQLSMFLSGAFGPRG